MHFLQAINSDISVLIVCNKTGGTIKGDIKKHVLSSHVLHTCCLVHIKEKKLFVNIRTKRPFSVEEEKQVKRSHYRLRQALRVPGG